MARSAKATETFTLVAVRNKNARGKKSLKFPGLVRVNRRYTGSDTTNIQDSQNGEWIQLCPGLFYQPHDSRTANNKGGRALHAQFEDIEIHDSSIPQVFERLDYTTWG
jgi:hypothetical protein